MHKSANQTVIFDFDGTLANTVELVMRIYNEHAAQFGAEQVSAEEFPELRKLGYKKAMKAKNLHWRHVPHLAYILRSGIHQHLQEVRPYDGVREMLHDLKNADLTIGVLTSNDGTLVQEFLETHEFPLFDFVVSEKAIFGKDKALKKIMHRHELTPDQVVYVGDEPRDVTASKKAGVYVIGVTWGFGGPESMEATQPDKTVSTVSELKEAIYEAIHTA